MKNIAWGAFVLNIVLLVVVVLLVAAALWILVPAAFPALNFGWGNAVALAGLLFLVKATFK